MRIIDDSRRRKAMKLVIVESPAKCLTIKKYLGDGYRVEASLGHVRDLSTRGKGGLGVDIENGFAISIYIFFCIN